MSTIIKCNGIFCINPKLETSSVKINPEFKALVDSVIKHL